MPEEKKAAFLAMIDRYAAENEDQQYPRTGCAVNMQPL